MNCSKYPLIGVKPNLMIHLMVQNNKSFAYQSTFYSGLLLRICSIVLHIDKCWSWAEQIFPSNIYLIQRRRSFAERSVFYWWKYLLILKIVIKVLIDWCQAKFNGWLDGLKQQIIRIPTYFLFRVVIENSQHSCEQW